MGELIKDTSKENRTMDIKHIGKIAAALAVTGWAMSLTGCDSKTSSTTKKTTTESPSGTVTETHKDEVKVNPK
jgi:hypothetical protein